MTTDDDALRVPFRDWLAKRWPDARDLELGPFRMPRSGFSARTIFVPVRFRQNGRPAERELVLRIENPEPAVYPQQAPGLDVEIEIQYRAMQGLIATGKLPLAPLVGYEADASILGQPFFAMDFVKGDVMTENPPYSESGFFFEASPDLRRRILRRGLETLVAFHTVDWRTAGFDWLVHPTEPPTFARQIDLWEGYMRRELGDRVHPDFDLGVAWLRHHLPTDLVPALSWGDSRPGNFLFEADRVLCITDFENIAIAPKEIDLGWWLLFDRTMHESIDRPRLPGEPTRQEQRAIYAAAAGIPVPDTYRFELFAAVRYAAIVVRVMNRLVARGVLPADQVIWRENPAATALKQILVKGGIA